MNKFKNQPKPELNENSKPVWPEVIKGLSAIAEDLNLEPNDLNDLKSIMDARDQFGRQKYGVPLSTFNGRMALQDAFEEALDLVVYSLQAYLEARKEESKSLWAIEEVVENSFHTLASCYKAIKEVEKRG